MLFNAIHILRSYKQQELLTVLNVLNIPMLTVLMLADTSGDVAKECILVPFKSPTDSIINLSCDCHVRGGALELLPVVCEKDQCL